MAEQDFDCRLVDEDFELEVEGTGPGELLVVEEQDPDGLPYWTHHLLLRRDGMLEPLGRIGTNVGRGCSVGFVEIEQARWLTGADVRLVVELHAEGEYSCYESSPWDDCIAAAQEAGKPESTCDGVSQDYPIDITDVRYRMICAELDGRLRCSTPPEFPGQEAEAAAARFDPLPTGSALASALGCPLEDSDRQAP